MRLVAGYVAVAAQASPDAAEGIVAERRDSFAAYAQREGYSLGPVFFDVRGRAEAGLYGLAEYLRRDDAVGVVVPDLGHLTRVRPACGRVPRRVGRRSVCRPGQRVTDG